MEEGEDGDACAANLDKRFGFSKELTSRLDVDELVGRGHFAYTCSARFKKGVQWLLRSYQKQRLIFLYLQSCTDQVIRCDDVSCTCSGGACSVEHVG